MTKGLVSVIVPAYNSAEFIMDTIRSVQAQTYTNWEMIVVDDCSTDNTVEVLTNCSKQEPRVKYFRLETNSGPAIARNKAMELAEGEYMAFLDSDDLWLPTKLERQLAFMQENDYAFTFTSYEQVDDTGAPLGVVKPAVEKTCYDRMLLNNVIGNSTAMYSVDKLGKFTVPPIRKRNDYALWLKIFKVVPYAYGLPEILAQYRIRPGSVSHNKLSLIKYQWELYYGIEKLGVLRSFFLVARQCVLKLLKK